MPRYPGEIKDPDPPSGTSGAIVGNQFKHIALGTLYFSDYVNNLKDCIADGVDSDRLIEHLNKQKDSVEEKAPVFIYINNLGYQLKKGQAITFDIQVVDPSPLTVVAINIVPA